MKRMMMTAVWCACVLGVADASAAQGDKMAKKTDRDMMKSMTVTGCVAEKDGHYMLDNAMTSGDTTAMSYELRGGDLKAHVGHKVEVTGSSDAKMGMMEHGKMDGGKMAHDKMTDKDKSMSDTHGVLRVKSVRMIAASCS
jgi:hypothetical protein